MKESKGTPQLWDKIRSWLGGLGPPEVLAIAVTLLGLALRIEHAMTFDGVAKGSDYAAYMRGVRWTLEHMRPLDFEPTVPQINYAPPVWFVLAAGILRATGSERWISALSVVGWLVRQLLLAKILRTAAPRARWSRLAALSLHAVLPLSVLIDGKVNLEGPHATFFLLATYALWRMERQADTRGRISWRTSALFGLFAGIALLIKATSAVLVIAAVLILCWRGVGWFSRFGACVTWRRFLRPALPAALVWCVVTGWWVGPNLMKYGHPFPHNWDLETPTEAVMTEPVPYRRPLGWALPFEWSEYLRFPVNRSEGSPRPNFWSFVITGTWTDFYNRGFCRLKGGDTTERVWGGRLGGVSMGPGWEFHYRCLPIFRALLAVGLPITLASSIAVLHTAWLHVYTRGRRGSLVLPSVIVLSVFFIMLFALTYPRDGSAVLNPRYLLIAQAPMLACAGLGLARLEAAYFLRWVALGLSFVAIAAIGVLLLYERFGT